MMFQCTEMTVLERQRAGFNWQQQQHHFPLQQQNNYFGHDDHMTATALFHGQLQQPLGNDGGLLNEMVMKPDPGLVDNGVGFPGSCLDMNYYSNVSNSANLAGFGAGIPEQITSPGVGTQGSKKRKFDKGTADEKIMEKNSKEAEDRNSKVAAKNNNNSCSSNHKNSNSNKENSGETSKDNSKVTEVQKPDYIHVRARRGQATDSHSLAERVRREKISERMKYLQDLVPGCNKITGKAGMLDEIINYVQSLQRQVEFLSMKLATVNPRIDFNIDNLFVKEVLPVSSMNFPTSAISADTTTCSLFQFNPLQQTIPCGELDTWINHSDMRLKRTLSPPISLPETLLDTSCFTPSTNWDIDLQNLYNQTLDHGRSTSFPSQQFTGSLDG